MVKHFRNEVEMRAALLAEKEDLKKRMRSIDTFFDDFECISLNGNTYYLSSVDFSEMMSYLSSHAYVIDKPGGDDVV